MAIPTGEKALGAELLVSMTIVTVARIREQKAFPTPSQYVATVTAFWLLSAAALVGPRSAKLAAGIGGLFTLTLVAKHGAAAFFAIGNGVSKVALVDDSSPTTQTTAAWADFRNGFATVQPAVATTPAPATIPTAPVTPQKKVIWT